MNETCWYHYKIYPYNGCSVGCHYYCWRMRLLVWSTNNNDSLHKRNVKHLLALLVDCSSSSPPSLSDGFVFSISQCDLQLLLMARYHLTFQNFSFFCHIIFGSSSVGERKKEREESRDTNNFWLTQHNVPTNTQIEHTTQWAHTTQPEIVIIFRFIFSIYFFSFFCFFLFIYFVQTV